MDEFLNENYDSKWEILGQMFIIEQILARHFGQ